MTAHSVIAHALREYYEDSADPNEVARKLLNDYRVDVLTATRSAPVDEPRREAYAAAIYEQANPGSRWADAHPHDRECFGWDGDAALAVADAEQAGLRARIAELEQQ